MSIVIPPSGFNATLRDGIRRTKKPDLHKQLQCGSLYLMRYASSIGSGWMMKINDAF
jgi:hypothetical protein